MRGEHRWIARVALLVVIAAAACTSDDEGSDPATTTEPATASSSVTTSSLVGTSSSATTSTTVAPPMTTEPPQPTRVLLVGDSLMEDTAAAAISALTDAVEPFDVVHDRGYGALPHTDVYTERWRSTLVETEPDVVIIYVGVWEARASGGLEPPVGEPGFDAVYRREILAPWFDGLHDEGIHTVFLGMAPMLGGPLDDLVQITVDVTEIEAASRVDVDFVRTESVVSPEGGGVHVLPDPRTGVDERVRRVDGVHLCPDGVERVVDLILERLALVTDITVGDDWRSGAWRTDVVYVLEAECPPVG